MLSRKNKIQNSEEMKAIYLVVKNNPQALTNEHIQTIGCLYLARHGDEPGLFRAHTHHNIAKNMKNYSKETTIDVKWDFLAEAYGRLVNTNGEIARTITQLFVISFNKNFIRLGVGNTDYEAYEVSSTLKSYSNEYFMKMEIAHLRELSYKYEK